MRAALIGIGAIVLLCSLVGVGLRRAHADSSANDGGSGQGEGKTSEKMTGDKTVSTQHENLSEAIFAGGCFWCMQPAFDNTPGVVETIVGYTGGSVKNPTYEQISTGRTGHAESILVRYDPTKVSYTALLDEFWKNIDPTQVGGQFADRGPQYRTVIFYLNPEQKAEAERSKAALDASRHFKLPIVTAIDPATEFYPAEDEHQKYYMKNAAHYKMYKYGSGRAAFIEEHWGER